MKLFDSKIYADEKRVYIILKGKIDTRTVSEFKKTLEKVKSLRKKEIILHYKNVDYVSSAGYGALLRFSVLCKKDGINVIATGMRQEIKNIFDIMELYRFVNYRENIPLPSSLAEEVVEEKPVFTPEDYKWIESKIIENPLISIDDFYESFKKERRDIDKEDFKKVLKEKNLFTKEERLFFAYKKLKEKIEKR